MSYKCRNRTGQLEVARTNRRELKPRFLEKIRDETLRPPHVADIIVPKLCRQRLFLHMHAVPECYAEHYS